MEASSLTSCHERQIPMEVVGGWTWRWCGERNHKSTSDPVLLRHNLGYDGANPMTGPVLGQVAHRSRPHARSFISSPLLHWHPEANKPDLQPPLALLKSTHAYSQLVAFHGIYQTSLANRFWYTTAGGICICYNNPYSQVAAFHSIPFPWHLSNCSLTILHL